MRTYSPMLLIITILCLMLPTAFASFEEPIVGETVLVKVEKTDLYSSASASGNKSGSLTEFEPVKILEQTGNFSKVQTQDKTTGYVETSDLAPSRFATTDISSGKVNVRAGETINTHVKFRLDDNYPVKVLQKKKDRVQIVDYEGDTGWIHENLLKVERFIVATPPQGLDWINMREGPGLDENGKPKALKRFRAERGAVFKVLDEKDGWIKVQHADGDQAWCSANIVWGFYDE